VLIKRKENIMLILLNQQEEELVTEQYIDESGTLISFVNHHFGPLRGLNFIVKGKSKEDIRKFLLEQPFDTIDDIWEQTLISSRAMALPMQLLDELESPPIEVDSLEEGQEQIRKNVVLGNLTGDPFFFRSFII
jgi:hypothetical protein